MNETKETTLKVTSDVKDAVNRIGTDLGGKTQREVVEYLISLYRAHQEQESGRTVPALAQLHHHFARIEEVYVEWVRATWDQEDRHATECSHWQAELVQSQQTANEWREQWERGSIESEARLQSAQAEVQSIQEQTAREREEMNSRLTQANTAQEQSAQLAQFAKAAAEEAERRAAALEERVRATDQLTLQLQEAVKRNETAEQELTRIREKMTMDVERATLEVERKYMNLIIELRESLSTVREENAQLQIRLAKA